MARRRQLTAGPGPTVRAARLARRTLTLFACLAAAPSIRTSSMRWYSRCRTHLCLGPVLPRLEISFRSFATRSKDKAGNANPIAGTVSKVIDVGSSQSGSFIRGSIFYGFNQDETGHRIVVDGAWPQIDGRMMWANERWAQENVIPNLYMGGDESPVWWADFPNQARGLPPSGMLDRCTQSRTCPEILETFGSNEFYDEKDGAGSDRLLRHLHRRYSKAEKCPSVLPSRHQPWREH